MSELTRLLNNAAGGDTVSLNQLYDLVFAELRAMAAHKMASERPGHTLQPTALVNEAYLRLGRSEGFKFENRAHFFTAAAEAMRRILVDNARDRLPSIFLHRDDRFRLPATHVVTRTCLERSRLNLRHGQGTPSRGPARLPHPGLRGRPTAADACGANAGRSQRSGGVYHRPGGRRIGRAKDGARNDQRLQARNRRPSRRSH